MTVGFHVLVLIFTRFWGLFLLISFPFLLMFVCDKSEKESKLYSSTVL